MASSGAGGSKSMKWRKRCHGNKIHTKRCAVLLVLAVFATSARPFQLFLKAVSSLQGFTALVHAEDPCVGGAGVFGTPGNCKAAGRWSGIRAPHPQGSSCALRAGFSLHTSFDLDLAVPDEILFSVLPGVLAAAAVVAALSSLKSAIDGPPDFKLQPGSLCGRTIMITGGSAGLGFESARRLAENGATVIATARSQAKAWEAEAALRAQSASDNVHVLVLDLADLSSIRAFVQECQQHPWGRRIDVLLNNAGVMAVPACVETANGFEMQIGVNHLGHFALTGMLLPLLGSADSETACRVINVSSSAHRLGDSDALIQTLCLQRRKAGSAGERQQEGVIDGGSRNRTPAEGYPPWPAYILSKLANVVFAKELDRRFRAAGKRATAVSLHPGLCATELARYVVSGKDKPMEESYVGYAPPLQGIIRVLKGMLRPVSRGVNNHIFLAAGADGGYDCSGGEYFEDLQPAQAHAEAGNATLGSRLWEESERLTGVAFDFVSMGTGQVQVEAV